MFFCVGNYLICIGKLDERNAWIRARYAEP